MKQTIDKWLNTIRGIHARIGVPTYKAHRHLLIQDLRLEEFKSGQKRLFDLERLFPNVDKKLTKKEFEAIKDGLIETVTK